MPGDIVSLALSMPCDIAESDSISQLFYSFFTNTLELHSLYCECLNTASSDVATVIKFSNYIERI